MDKILLSIRVHIVHYRPFSSTHLDSFFKFALLLWYAFYDNNQRTIMLTNIQQKLNTLSLDSLTQKVGEWLDEHPTIFKIVVFANHLFRAIAMFALMVVLPYSFLTNCVISLAASLAYRLTIERFCHFRFAIPACLGGIALHMGLPAIEYLVNNIAFQTFGLMVETFVGLGAMALYTAGIIWISHSSVENRPATASCCNGQ